MEKMKQTILDKMAQMKMAMKEKLDKANLTIIDKDVLIVDQKE